MKRKKCLNCLHEFHVREEENAICPDCGTNCDSDSYDEDVSAEDSDPDTWD